MPRIRYKDLPKQIKDQVKRAKRPTLASDQSREVAASKTQEENAAAAAYGWKVDGESLVITLPPAPSVNSYYRVYRGRSILSKVGRQYQKDVLRILDGCPKIAGRLSMEIVFYPKDRRISDLDNRLKSLIDGMTHGGVYDDDSQIDDLRIMRREVQKPGRMVITINEIKRNGLDRP
jgi:crossover junction endodeoxyribonuclease RusA